MDGTHFSFMTKAFADSPEAVEQRVNAEIGGHALAVWLSGALRAGGLEAGEPWVEDHGWDFDIQDGKRVYLCVCTIEDSDSDHREGHVTLDLRRSLSDRLLGRNRHLPGDPVVEKVWHLLSQAREIEQLARD
ncbi:MAG: hypothetical protein SFW09_03795 [Hyphomicrobiaceae bacterium]|nr:hypothetical protein [Hyphomicrobiaceae bacterium]